METCLELANDSHSSRLVIVHFVRAYVRRGWLPPRSIRAISLVYHVPLYVVQTRGGWLRAARSIPKVALAYRLHTRVLHAYTWSVAAPAPTYLPPLRTNTKTIFCRFCTCDCLRKNPPSFPRDVSKPMQDIDNTAKTCTRCLFGRFVQNLLMEFLTEAKKTIVFITWL